MTDSTLLSIRLKTDIAKKLLAIAKYEDRSKSFLGAKAIERYVTEREAEIEEIKMGIKDYEKGYVSTNQEVQDWIHSWGKEDEKPMPGRKKLNKAT